MKNTLILLWIFLVNVPAVIGQITIQQGAPMEATAEPTTIHNIYMAIFAMSATALIFLAIYSLSKTIEVLAGRVIEKYNYPEREG